LYVGLRGTCAGGIPNRLSHLDRITGETIRRYEHDWPGDLLHVDIKNPATCPAAAGTATSAAKPATATAKPPPDVPGNDVATTNPASAPPACTPSPLA
jgi:hypothetical protein